MSGCKLQYYSTSHQEVQLFKLLHDLESIKNVILLYVAPHPRHKMRTECFCGWKENKCQFYFCSFIWLISQIRQIDIQRRYPQLQLEDFHKSSIYINFETILLQKTFSMIIVRQEPPKELPKEPLRNHLRTQKIIPFGDKALVVLVNDYWNKLPKILI